MIETIVESNLQQQQQQQQLSSSAEANYLVTYNLAPSQQRARIRSILAARKRRSHLLLSSTSNKSVVTASLDSISPPPPQAKTNSSEKKQKQVFDDLMLNGGLPSPPVDSPKAEFPSLNNYDDPSLDTTNKALIPTSSTSNSHGNSTVGKGDNELTIQDIQSKLTALREEKHDLFQLMKRLVEQEEQRQAMAIQQQQQQQQTRKRKQSRWVPTLLDSKKSSTRLLQPTYSPRSDLKSYKSHEYFGQQQQPVIHHPPYFY